MDTMVNPGCIRLVLTVTLSAVVLKSARAQEVTTRHDSDIDSVQEEAFDLGQRVGEGGTTVQTPVHFDSGETENNWEWTDKEALPVSGYSKAPPTPKEKREYESENPPAMGVGDNPLEEFAYVMPKPEVDAFLKEKLKPIIIGPLPKPLFSDISPESEKAWSDMKKEHNNRSTDTGATTGEEDESAAVSDATEPPSATTANVTLPDSTDAETLSSEIPVNSEKTQPATPDQQEHSTTSVVPVDSSQDRLRVPLCCLNDDENASCQRLLLQSVYSLPIAFGHCNDPEERSIEFDETRDFCPNRNATKVILDNENKIIYTQNKMLFHWNMIFINDFCVEVPANSRDLEYRVLICSSGESSRHPEHCRAGVCHTKCCPEGYLLQSDYCVCYDAPASSIGPSFFNRSLKRGLLGGTDNLVRFPKCESPDVITGNSSKKGAFQFDGDDVSITDSSLDFCVDHLLDLQDSRNIVTTTLAVVVCPRHPEDDESTWTVVRRVLIPLGLVVSCVFLAATLLCHLCLPALRDIRGLYLAAYVASLLVADSALFTTQAFSQFLAPASCVSLALLLHVAFLSTFFWLNVICYDVWTYVRLSVQGVPLHRTQDDMTRFLVRAVYAWGCPLIMGIVAAVMQLLPEDKDGYLKPNFVANRCWFRDGVEILAYFYGPMGILCIVNTLLILHTGLVLYCANNRCHCFFGSCGQTNHTFDRQHLNEFWQRFGLFAIMASCWLTEVISSIVGSGDSELWAVTDTLNTFQGVFIFITFIRSTKRRRLVQERLEAWMERVERGGLPAPSLPAGASPSCLLHRVRNSSIWSSVGRAWGRAPCRRKSHLSSKQVLDNIIFKEKMEDKKGFNNQVFEDEERDEDPDGDAFSREDSVNRSANSIWTVSRWRSLRSNAYFPNEVEVRDRNDSNGAPSQDDAVICENFMDSLSIYSSYSQDANQRSSSLESPQNQRPIFTQWNLLRLKSGSLNLPSGGFAGGTPAGRYNDVICQGLTRKDSFSKK